MWLIKSGSSKSTKTMSTCKQESSSSMFTSALVGEEWCTSFMAKLNYLWWFKKLKRIQKIWRTWQAPQISVRFFCDFILGKLSFYIALKHWPKSRASCENSIYLSEDFALKVACPFLKNCKLVKVGNT